MSDSCPTYECCPPNDWSYSASGGPPEPPVSIGNDEQTYEATCPEGQTGSPSSYTVPADTYFAETKAEANQQALNVATAHALEGLVCEQPSDCTNLVPEMTANDAPDGECFSSAELFDHEAFRAFDRNPNTYWVPGPGITSGVIGYQFQTQTAINTYSIQAIDPATGSPRDWNFEGSDDGVSWTVLDTQSLQTWTASEIKSYSCANTTPYLYYRLNITATTGSPTQNLNIAEITLSNCGEDNSTDTIQFANGEQQPATAYPSIKQVSGFVGTLAGVTVDLVNILHNAPEAMSLVLQAPDGTAVMLFNHSGNGLRFFNPAVTVTFDDAAGAEIPVNSGSGAISGGSYLLTVEAGRETEQLPGAAPTQPYGTQLSDFIGINPNGAWTLWCIHRHFYSLFDPNFAKIIDGWDLTLS